MLQAIKYDAESGLQMLDQLLLPQKSQYITISGVDAGFTAIKSMQVRLKWVSSD